MRFPGFSKIIDIKLFLYQSKFQPLKCRGGTYGPSDEQAGAMQACASKYGTEPGQQNPNVSDTE